MIYFYQINYDTIYVLECETQYEMTIDETGRDFWGYCGVKIWLDNLDKGTILVMEARDFTEFADWVERQYPEIFL